jgi:hypothetical protein
MTPSDAGVPSHSEKKSRDPSGLATSIHAATHEMTLFADRAYRPLPRRYHVAIGFSAANAGSQWGTLRLDPAKHACLFDERSGRQCFAARSFHPTAVSPGW